MPVGVQGLTGLTSIAVGNGHSCATASDGKYCWGSNQHFELGTDTSTGEFPLPVQVSDPAACAKAQTKLEKAEKKLKKLKKKENASPKAIKKAKKAVKEAKAAVKEAC